MSSFNFIRTIYSVALETCKQVNHAYIPLQGSTLNELYSLDVMNGGEFPALEYFGIGLRYDDTFIDSGLSQTDISRDPLDITVERPIPFLAVKKTIGLSSSELNMYRLIIEKEINGEWYYLCYLKRINKSLTKSGYYDVEYEDKEYTINKRLTVDNSELNHEPIVHQNLYKDRFKYVAYRHAITLSLTQTEITNIKSAIDLIYPDQPEDIRHSLGEVMLVSGNDVIYNGRTEISNAQTNIFFGLNVVLNELSSDSVVNIVNVDIGGMQMLMKELT